MLMAAGWPDSTPFAITWHGTTTDQQTVVATLGSMTAELKAAGISLLTARRPGHRRRRRGHRRAARAVLVRDQAAVRLAGAGAADQGAGRGRLRPAARARRRAGAGADHRGRAAADTAADGARGQGPGHRPVPVDRLHLGQRGPRGTGEVRGVRPGRARVRRGEGRRGRRADRGGAARLRHHAGPDAGRRAVRRGTGQRVARLRRRARPDQPGAAAEGRHRHREPASPGSPTSAGRPRT